MDRDDEQWRETPLRIETEYVGEGDPWRRVLPSEDLIVVGEPDGSAA